MPSTCLAAVAWFLGISVPMTVVFWVAWLGLCRRWYPWFPDTAGRRILRWLPAICAWFLFLMSLFVRAGAR